MMGILFSAVIIFGDSCYTCSLLLAKHHSIAHEGKFIAPVLCSDQLTVWLVPQLLASQWEPSILISSLPRWSFWIFKARPGFLPCQGHLATGLPAVPGCHLPSSSGAIAWAVTCSRPQESWTLMQKFTLSTSAGKGKALDLWGVLAERHSLCREHDWAWTYPKLLRTGKSLSFLKSLWKYFQNVPI